MQLITSKKKTKKRYIISLFQIHKSTLYTIYHFLVVAGNSSTILLSQLLEWTKQGTYLLISFLQIIYAIVEKIIIKHITKNSYRQ